MSHAADAIYLELLQGMTPEQSLAALLTFTDTRTASRLQSTLPQQKFQQILALLDTKLIGPSAKQLHQSLTAFSGSYAQARHDSMINAR